MIIHVLAWYRRRCLRTLPSSVGYVGCIQDSKSRVFPGHAPDMRATNTPEKCMKACLRKGEHSITFLFVTVSKETQRTRGRVYMVLFWSFKFKIGPKIFNVNIKSLVAVSLSPACKMLMILFKILNTYDMYFDAKVYM